MTTTPATLAPASGTSPTTTPAKVAPLAVHRTKTGALDVRRIASDLAARPEARALLTAQSQGAASEFEAPAFEATPENMPIVGAMCEIGAEQAERTVESRTEAAASLVRTVAGAYTAAARKAHRNASRALLGLGRK